MSANTIIQATVKGATDAAEGAVGGIAAGPFGALAGALIALLPDVRQWIFGSAPADAAAQQAAMQAVKSTLGTTDPDQVSNVLAANPNAAMALSTALAAITTEHEQLTMAARVQIAGAAPDGQGSVSTVVSFSALGISVLFLLMWAGSLWMQQRGHPALPPDDASVLRYVAVLIAGYWIGSSAESAQKTQSLLARMMPSARG